VLGIQTDYLQSICSEQGSTGAVGPVGEQGSTGAVGPVGEQGPVGAPTPSTYLGDELTQNTCIGLNSNECYGRSNVYVGYKCAVGDLSSENVYIGSTTGIEPSGGMNTLIGSECGKYNSGTQNTYIGVSVAACTGTSGSHNLYAGAEAGFNNTTGFGNVFLGAVAGACNTEGSWNTFIGQSAGHSNQFGTNNIFIGANSGMSSVSGNSCICIGDGADTSSEIPINQLVFGQGVVSAGDNTVTFPSNLRTMPSGTEVCFSNSGGGCLYPVSSSIRWKENVRDIKENIDTSKIYDLRPVTFNSSERHGDTDELFIGLIAEEGDKIFPVLVPKDDLGRPSSVKYSLVAILLIEEIKKLRQELNILKIQINNLNK
jgi:hypothetical protein